MPDLAEKDSYDQLTDKQQAVVDEIINAPDADNTEIAERAGVARSTVYNVKNKYGEIVEKELNKQGREFEGEEQTTGDPFEALSEQLGSAGVQYISERPAQPNNGDTMNQEELAVTLTRADVEAILQGGCVPESFRSELVARVVELAFSDEG